MKKLRILAVAVLALMATSVSAQKVNNWMFEGNLGFQYSDDESTKTTDININLGANYQFHKNWQVGLQVGFNNEKVEHGATTDKCNLFYFTPQVRYMRPLCGKLSWTPRGYFSFGFGKIKSETGNLEIENDVTNMEIGINLLSFEYEVSRHIAVGVTFGMGDLYYRDLDRDQLGSYKAADFHFGNWKWDDQNITFAFHYYL